MSPILPAWLNLKQAAQYTGLCQQSIKNLIKLGKVKSSRLEIKGSQRGRRLVKRESLDAVIEAGVGVNASAGDVSSPSGATVVSVVEIESGVLRITLDVRIPT